MADNSRKTILNTLDRIADAIESVEVSQETIAGGVVPPIVYATLSVDTSGDDPVYSCDKTLDEILDAIEAGSFVFMKSGDTFIPLSGFANDKVVFQATSCGQTKLDIVVVEVESDAITVTEESVTLD